MLDNLTENISYFGNYVFNQHQNGTKSQEKHSSTGMVYGLKETGGLLRAKKIKN